MRRIPGLFLSLLLFCSLTACGRESSPEPAPIPTPTGTAVPEQILFALPRTLSTLHPILGSDRTNLALAPLLWEGLFELDNTFTPQNVLCKSYAVSPDGLVWTFYLRTDVTFSDGSPLTAAEAAQSLQLAKKADCRYAGRLSQLASVIPAGTHTLTVTLTAPNGSLPALLDIPIIKGESEEPLGTGPYVIESCGTDARLVLRGDWWQKKSLPFDGIFLQTVEGADILIHAFDTNVISLVTTDLTGTNALGYSTGYEVWDCPTTIMLFMGFNTARGVCSDAPVRQALSRCFDRSTLAASLFVRHAEAAALPVPPSSPLYDAGLAAQLDYSAQTAADLLAQAGYTLTDGVLKRGSSALSLTLLVNSENSFRVAAADYLAGELGKLGIATQLRKLPWTDYEQALRAGHFDLFLGETMLTADFDLTELLTKAGALNYGKYSNAETAALLSAFRAGDGQARGTAALALYRKLGEDVPFAPLCFKNASVLTQWGLISGLSPSQNNAFFNLSGWKLASSP